MQYQQNQKIVNSAAFHCFECKTEILPEPVSCSKGQSVTYLRSWGIDYTYLAGNEKYMRGFLPIPENSEAQKYIRRLAGYTPVK